MINLMLTQEIVNKNKVLSLAFSYKPFEDLLPDFILQANKAVDLDPSLMIRELLRSYVKYGKGSAGYRTMLFDLAWAVYEQHPELWSDEEREEGFSDLAARCTELYPDMDPEMADLDVLMFSYGQYFAVGIDFCFNARLDDPIRPLICRSMYIFFERWSFQYNEEIMEETQVDIESWIEEHNG